MKARLLQQLATAAKILKLPKGYAESSIKRSATIILNNKAKASTEAVRLAQKFRASLVKNSKSISKSTPAKSVKRVTESNFDIKESTIKHDKLSILSTFSKFRQRLLIFDYIMGSFRNTWWAKPLLVAYLMISYVFSAYLLARIAFFIEILQLDFWGFIDYIKNLDLNDIEGLFTEWEPVPSDPNAPNLGLNKVPVEADPFSGSYIKQVDPKEYSLDQINRAKILAEKALEKLSKTATHLPDILNSGSNAYTKALQGLNEAYAQAVNQYGSLSDFRRALGLYTGIRGWFNAWIGYPLADAASWLFSGNPFYTLFMFSLATIAMYCLDLNQLFSLIMYLPLKVLSFPVDALDWFMCNYMDTYIVWFNNKLHYIVTKTGFSEMFTWVEGREMEGDNISEAIRHHNNQMAGYKTYPTTLSTDRMGQGIVRESIIDYVNELGTYPEILVDKGKGPDGTPSTFKDFIKGWFGGNSSDLDESRERLRRMQENLDESKERLRRMQENLGQSSEPFITPGIVVEDTAMLGTNPESAGPSQSTGTLTPRVVTRTGSGSITPTAASAAVGVGIALETETVGDALEAVSAKLTGAVSPTTDTADLPPDAPVVRFSADYHNNTARVGSSTHLGDTPNPYKTGDFRPTWPT